MSNCIKFALHKVTIKIYANELYLRSEGFRTRPPVADD